MNQDKNTAGSSGDTFSKDNLKSEMAAGKGKLSELADSAASAGKAQLDSGLGQAAGQVEGVAKVIDETADRLRKDSHDGLASYATQIAGSIESVADRLRNSSVDELATEARQLARSNPALFLLGSVAVGFGLTRFLKASSRISHDYDDTGRMRQDVYGSTYGDTRDPTHDWDSGTGGRSQGGWDAGSRSSSGAAGSNWDRSGTAGAGASSGAGSSGSLGGSSGAGSSHGASSSGWSVAAQDNAAPKAAPAASAAAPAAPAAVRSAPAREAAGYRARTRARAAIRSMKLVRGRCFPK